MDRSSDRLGRVRAQFTRQSDAYARMAQTVDAKALAGLASLTGLGPEGRALDVACGPGFLTLALAARGREATGLDATPAFLEMARAEAARRGVANVAFREGDAEALPFESGGFDVVTCRAAFHHFPRPERVLAEMRRVARSGGRLLVADLLGSEDAAESRLHDRIERLCDPTHVRALPESAFDRLFAEAGTPVVARPKSTLHYDVEEWIAHGGPDPDTTDEIVRLFEAQLAEDRTGLDVRREDGRLRFSHRAAAFLLSA